MKKDSGNTKLELNCPYCGSSAIIKKGKRQNKFKQVQLYFCKDCDKRFSNEKFKSKTYTISSIVKAISKYNSGLTIEQTAKKTRIPQSTIAKWITEYKSLFNLARQNRKLQKFAINETLIQGHKYFHQLIYLYLQHNFKLEHFVKHREPKLYKYLQTAKNGAVGNKFFMNSQARASQTKLNILNQIKFRKSYNNSCRFANIAIDLVDNNRKRHWAVEKIMLENDTSTIAVEVPVYLKISTSTIPWIRNIKSKNDYITGHIDLLQYRNGKLYILDYKPGAEKEKPLGQLFVYACCLSKSSNIHFSKMILAWFDEKNYFETDAIEVYRFVMKNFK